MKDNIIVSIIIPCFNAEKYIKNCLDSILKTKPLNYEIIVVDDSSKDKTRKILAQYKNLERINIIYLNENGGPAKARNIGAFKSKGKYLFFLDVDTQIDSDCLKQVVKKFKQDEQAGAVQAKLLKAKSSKIDAVGHFLTCFGFPYEIGVGEDEKKHNDETIIFGARTAGMGIAKNLFQKIDGFDEDYFIYGEDTDLSWRIWLAGYNIYYLPKGKVYHFQKSSLNAKTAHRLLYEGAKNNFGNIIKNTPIKTMLWLLPLHILGWTLISIRLIFQKRFSCVVWICKGLVWNIKNLGLVLKKRKTVSLYTNKNNQCKKIMFGKISFKILFKKGLRWLRYV